MYKMKKLVGNFAFLTMIVIIIAKLSSVFVNAPFPLSVVASNSMEPTLNRGDIIPWIPCSINEVKKGDIVVYKSSFYNKYIVHRVSQIIIKNGKKLLITKGDANNYTDQSGPHAPEPPISDEMLQGKLISFGKNAVKLPYAGYIWLFSISISKKLAAPLTWRSSQKDHFIIFTPFLFFFSIFLLLIVMWLPNGKSMQEKLHDLIFGEERISISSIISYSLIIFIPMLLFTSFFSFDHASINENTKDLPVFNPSLIKVRVISFSEGVKTSPHIFDVGSGKDKVLNLMENGTGSVYVYSSPFWRIIPINLMIFFYNMNPKLCVFLSSLFSAFLIAILSSIILIMISMIWDNFIRMAAYSTFLSIYGKIHKFKFPHLNIKIYKWIKSKVYFLEYEEENKRLYFAFLLYLPFSVFLLDGLFNLFLVCIISSIFVPIISYFMGIRFKNDALFLSFFSSLFYSTLFVAKGMVFIKHNFIISFIQFLAVSMLLSLIVFMVMFFITLLVMSLVRGVLERIDPVTLIKAGDI